MDDITLKLTEKYEIIFQSKELCNVNFKYKFEIACYEILQKIIKEYRDKKIDIEAGIISLSLGLCQITDLTGRTPEYEINRPAYKIETLRNPEIISSTNYMELMFKFVKYLQEYFEKFYDDIVLIIYTENGTFCKYFYNHKE